MRPIWSGSISFGLINIPVKIYSAVQEKALHFNYLRRQDLCPIKYVKVCRNTGEEVPYDEIVRGYEYQKGDYVIMTEEDFKNADRKKVESIEVMEFSKETEIDPKLLEKPYFLEPDKGAEKPYALLREALKKSKKVAVIKFVIRGRERLGVLRSEDDIIILNQMRFKEEVRNYDKLNLPGKKAVSKRELEMALKLIDQLTGVFAPEKFRDEYTRELEKVVAKKAKGETVKVKGEAPVPTPVPDIMERLKESLEFAQKKKS